VRVLLADERHRPLVSVRAERIEEERPLRQRARVQQPWRLLGEHGGSERRLGDEIVVGDVERLIVFEDDLRRAKIQLVIALVDEDALRIEHRPHRAVEEVDVLVCDCLNKVLHKQKSRRLAGAQKQTSAGSLAFF